MKQLIYALLAIACLVSSANAQQAVAPCTTIDKTNGVANCQPVTSSAPLPVTTALTPTNAISSAITSAAASSIVAKAAAGSVLSVSGSGVSGSFIMLFNTTTVPGDGAVTPDRCWGPLAATGPFLFAWSPGAVHALSTGITVVSSSTGCFTKTATNANFLSVEFQ